MNKNLGLILGFVALTVFGCNQKKEPVTVKREAPPNVLILLVDQWRAQATGYAGDPNVMTPNLDSLASLSVNFENAVSGMPVCSPFRASLLTGQRALTHGVFMNDVQLDTNAVTMGKLFSKAGYETGYIGKWHLDGQGRSAFIPPGNRRQGFQFWKANECTHNYNESVYYDNNDSIKKIWEDYDTFSQTNEALSFMKDKGAGDRPFLMVLSWGTPHAPYHTAPAKYRDLYEADKMTLRDNVPEDMRDQVKKDLSGYYAHMTALDDMIGKVLLNLRESGQLENTIILFTADHGDLLGSHGAYKKQQPYEESIRVPMLFYIPEHLKISPGPKSALINSEDLLPTLLGLSEIPIPETIEGINYETYLKGKEEIGEETLIGCIQPFGQWNRINHGGREYRGLVTKDHTYTRDLNGPWLLFDNKNDPYQINNLVGNPDFSELQSDLDKRLTKRLETTEDEFLPGEKYLEKWGYSVDETGTVPYIN